MIFVLQPGNLDNQNKNANIFFSFSAFEDPLRRFSKVTMSIFLAVPHLLQRKNVRMTNGKGTPPIKLNKECVLFYPRSSYKNYEVLM